MTGNSNAPNDRLSFRPDGGPLPSASGRAVIADQLFHPVVCAPARRHAVIPSVDDDDGDRRRRVDTGSA
jgi:hypothetical protein